MTLRQRLSSVWVARGAYNLGYAGAINALVDRLRLWPDWDAVWILNPDAEPTPNALAELMKYSIATGKGMIGSTILADRTSNRIAVRAGLRWNKLTCRSVFVGHNDAIDAPVDTGKIRGFFGLCEWRVDVRDPILPRPDRPNGRAILPLFRGP